MAKQHLLVIGDPRYFKTFSNDHYHFSSHPSQSVLHSENVYHLPNPIALFPLQKDGERYLTEEHITYLACGELFIVVCTNYNRLFGVGHSSNLEIVDEGVGGHLQNWVQVKLGEKLSEMLYGESTMNRITRLVCAGECVYVVVNDRWVFSRGSNTRSQLAIGKHSSKCGVFTLVSEFMNTQNGCGEHSRITHMKAGHFHACIVVDQKILFMAGFNTSGQLGIEDLKATNIFTRVTSLVLESGELIKEIGLGGAHTAVLTTRGRVFTVGWNARSELGSVRASWRLLADVPLVSKLFIDAKGNRTIVMSQTDSQFYGCDSIDRNYPSMSRLAISSEFNGDSRVEIQGYRISMFTIYDRSVIHGLTNERKYIDLRSVHMTITHLETGNIFMAAIVSPKTERSLPFLFDRLKDHKLSDVSFLFNYSFR